MNEDFLLELTNVISAHDDFNLKVVKTFVEVAKLFPDDSRDELVVLLRELLEEHKAGNERFKKLIEYLPGYLSNGK